MNTFVRVTYTEGNPPKSEAGVEEVFLKNTGGEYIICMVEPYVTSEVINAIDADAKATIISEADYNTDKNSGNYTENLE